MTDTITHHVGSGTSSRILQHVLSRASLVPVITVQLDKPVTFTCFLPDEGLKSRQLFWYKQSAGDELKLIATLKKFSNPQYAPGFSNLRLEVKHSEHISNLTILRTIHEDEGMYHCALVDWTNTTWTGMYLSVKGNSERTSTVVQTVSDPVRPGDSVTLQCSVLSNFDNKTCPGDHSVYWFRAGSDKSHPEIIYTGRNDECEKRPDSVKSCVYHFSKTVSSSDAGTYYCAVATCGQILFGNGTNLQIDQKRNPPFIALVILIVCLITSVIGNIVFICCRTSRPACKLLKGIESASSQATHGNSNQTVKDTAEAGHDLHYAALRFSGGKDTRGRKKKEMKTEESVYSQVKC
ncbi:signal-regulatory protein beta-2-like [Anabas testudineus]|uniref:signal-regulatory protein beta-2-like n=1 Tax=Anabas testudineus TaxID=64144 RepID=UPI000E453DAF|nr:signal-regulatory protein beta-2-like [Anabas testudineus]